MNILRHHDTTRRRIASVGMFDGVHAGHRFLIDFLASEARRRSVTPTVVTFADHPLTVVAPNRVPPQLTSPDEKLRLLAGSHCGDCIVLDFDEHLRRLPADRFIEQLKTDYAIDALVIGFNNRLGCNPSDNIDSYREIGARLGVEVISAPEFVLDGEKVSSSIIRRHLAEGRLDRANALLGRRYDLAGHIVHGRAIGRSLGFPTANLQPDDPRRLIPASGVYAALADIDGATSRAVVNIGWRPTVGDNPADITIEAHLLDFAADLYDSPMRLVFAERLRPERRFPTLDDLTMAIAADIAAARRLLPSLG